MKKKYWLQWLQRATNFAVLFGLAGLGQIQWTRADQRFANGTHWLAQTDTDESEDLSEDSGSTRSADDLSAESDTTLSEEDFEDDDFKLDESEMGEESQDEIVEQPLQEEDLKDPALQDQDQEQQQAQPKPSPLKPQPSQLSQPAQPQSPQSPQTPPLPLPEPAKPDPSLQTEPLAQPQLTPSEKEQYPPVGDSPNLGFEQRLNQIFERFNKNRISDIEWEQITGPKISDEYTIQSRDTLWDVSRTLFGDGYFWPKIWSLNFNITNPHEIYPGQKIRFYSGSVSEAPSVEVPVSMKKLSDQILGHQELEAQGPGTNGVIDTAELGSNGKSESAEEDEENVYIPPPAKVRRPVLNLVPPSLPQWQSAADTDFDEHGIAFAGKSKPVPVEVNMALRAFVVQEDLVPVGIVRETDTNAQTASLDQYVYVQMNHSQVGEYYTVIDQVQNKIGGFLFWGAVTPIAVKGEIRLMDVVNEKKRLYRALIVKAIGPIQIDSLLMAGRMPTANVSLQGQHSAIQAEILGVELDSEKKLIELGATVFLNKGRKDNLQIGYLLDVVADERLRKETNITIHSRVVGTVKIVHLDESVSTGIVVAAKDVILPGDFTQKTVVAHKSDLSTDDQSTSEELNENQKSENGEGEFDDDGDMSE